MLGMNRLWQAAGTVKAVLEQPRVLEKAVASGLRSLFVGFETVNDDNLLEQRKYQNIGRDYAAAVRRLHDLGVMVNGSFVFGMDGDGPDVFARTVEWAVEQGIETATFHILTPYPDTALHARMAEQGRLLHRDWDLYDTRHVVYRPARLSAEELRSGYQRAYHDFYRWGSILRGASSKATLRGQVRHVAYAGGWKKFEPLWDVLIRSRQVLHALPVLEAILAAGRGKDSPAAAEADEALRPNIPTEDSDGGADAGKVMEPTSSGGRRVPATGKVSLRQDPRLRASLASPLSIRRGPPRAS